TAPAVHPLAAVERAAADPRGAGHGGLRSCAHARDGGTGGVRAARLRGRYCVRRLSGVEWFHGDSDAASHAGARTSTLPDPRRSVMNETSTPSSDAAGPDLAAL